MYMKKSAGETWLSAVTQECHAWAARLSCMARASLCLSVVSSVSCSYQQFCLAEMMSQVLSFGALITGRNQRVFFLSYSQCNRAVWCCCRDVEVNFLSLPCTLFLIIWHLKELCFLNTQSFCTSMKCICWHHQTLQGNKQKGRWDPSLCSSLWGRRGTAAVAVS